MNKGGQFFLVAAAIIVALVIGLASAVNTIKSGDRNMVFYDLADEVGDETKHVLDYGVFNEEDPLLLTESFLENYTNYISQDQVLFIYGNSTNLTGIIYEELGIGSVGISTGGGITRIPVQHTTGLEADVSVDGNEILVNIDGKEYYFYMRDGWYFYFIIIKERGEERFVATEE